MRCDDLREALSARVDGEELGMPEHLVDLHLAGCAACRAWSEELAVLHRIVRVRAAEPVPDLSGAILGKARLDRRHRPAWPVIGAPVSWPRWALLAVALTQLVLAVPALVLGDTGGAPVHAARELGAFDVALATGLLLAAWQPARAWGLLPVMLVLGLVIAGTTVLDLAEGAASSGGEAHHALDLAGLGLLWLVAQERRPLDAHAA